MYNMLLSTRIHDRERVLRRVHRAIVHVDDFDSADVRLAHQAQGGCEIVTYVVGVGAGVDHDGSTTAAPLRLLESPLGKPRTVLASGWATA